MTMVEQLPPRRKVRGVFKRLALVSGVAFAIVCIPLAIMILPDQMRSIPEPPDNVWLSDVPQSVRNLSDRGRVSSKGTKGSVLGREERSEGAIPKATGESWLSGDTGFLTPEQLVFKCRPFPDLSKLPQDLRNCASEMNQAVDELARLPNELDGKTYEEALDRFDEIVRRYYEDRSIFVDSIEEDADCLSKEEEASIPPDYDLRTYLELYERVRLAIYARYEKWDKAATVCSLLNGVDENWVPDYDSHWWKYEVYYWRKAGGINGRFCLAWRSAAPIRGPIEKRVEGLLERVAVAVWGKGQRMNGD